MPSILFEHKGELYPFELKQGAKNEDGTRQRFYSVSDRKLVGNHITTDTADYSKTDPEEIGLRVSQSDWREGFQDDFFDNARKYAHSVNCDARFKGKVMLSPKRQTKISFPASTTTSIPVANGTFDSYNATSKHPDCWTVTTTGDGVVDASGGDCKLTTKNSSTCNIAYTFPWDDSLRGETLTVTFYGLKEALLDGAYGDVLDGVDTTTTQITATSSTEYTIVHTFNAAATQFVLRFLVAEAGVSGKYAQVDTVTCTRTDTPYGTTGHVVNFGTSLAIAVGSTLCKATGSSGYEEAVSVVYDFIDEITDLCVYGNYLYVCLGATNAQYYTSDLTTFVKSDQYSGSSVATTTKSDYSAVATAIDVVDTSQFTALNYVRWGNEVCLTAAVVDGDTLTLTRGQKGTAKVAHLSGTTIREVGAGAAAFKMCNCGDTIAAIADSTTTIRTSDNPLNDGTPWSTAYDVPNSTYTITDMVDDPNGNTIAMKQDGPVMFDEDEVIQAIPESSADVNTSISYEGYVWKGWLYAPAGKNKLRRKNLSTDAVEDISIVNTAQGDEDMDEEVTVMAADAEYLYVTLDNGTKVEILAARDEYVGSDVSWVWHPIWEFTSNDIISMCVSSVGSYKRLYAMTGTTADGVLVFTLPDAYSDPMKETGYEYESTGKFVTGWFETDWYENDKFWSDIKVAALNFRGYTNIRVQYQLEGDGEWDDDDAWRDPENRNDCLASELFSYTASPRAIEYPPPMVTTFEIGKRSRAIQFRFTLTTAEDTSSTDEISPVILRYGVYARVEKSLAGESTDKLWISAVLSLHGDGIERGGQWIRFPVDQQITALEMLKRAGEPLLFTGPDEVKRKVKFVPGEYNNDLDEDVSSEGPSFTAQIVLEEV